MKDPHGGDYFEPDYDEVSGTGLLGTTLRNVAILVGLCLGLAWIMSGVTSGVSDSSVAAGPAGASGAGTGNLKAVEDPDGLAQRAASWADEFVVATGPRGHFLVDIAVNGTPVRFLVDTGASSVILTAQDAERIGLVMPALDYSARFQTANGEIEAAPVVLRDMRLGGFELADVEATVTRAPLNISLLGMSFLKRLSSYEVGPEGLVLRF